MSIPTSPTYRGMASVCLSVLLFLLGLLGLFFYYFNKLCHISFTHHTLEQGIHSTDARLKNFLNELCVRNWLGIR